MRRLLLAVLGVLLASAAVASSGAATHAESRWVIRDLGTFGGRASEAIAINDRGEIVGTYDAPDRMHRHAFVWSNGVVRDLGRCKGDFNQTVPVAINDRGQIIGTCETWFQDRPDEEYSIHSRAFVWQKGRMTEIGAFGGKSSAAIAVNERGQVVGSADTKAKDHSGDPVYHAFLWQKGHMRDLGGNKSSAVDINDRGQIAVDGSRHAVLWQRGKLRDLGTLGGRYSGARAINDRGQVVGYAETRKKGGDGDVITHAFLWQNGRMRNLGSLGDYRSEALAINDRTQVFVSVDFGLEGSFLWQGGKRTKLGIYEDEGYALNDRGQLVGNDFNGAVLITTSPSSTTVSSTRLDPLPGAKYRSREFGVFDYEAVAINEHDQIVGWSTTRNGQRHAVLWTLKRG